MGVHDRVKNLTDKMQWRFIEGRWSGADGGEADVITRYTDIAVEVPKADLDAIAAYLNSTECFDKFYVDSALVLPDESTWRTVETVVDEGSQQEKMKKRRLLHTVVRTDQGSSVAVITEKGCRYRITYTWHEGETAVAAATQSTSGVWYRNLNAQRDSKTRLWSWIEEKRERMVQQTGAYTSEYDSGKVVGRQSFFGVRNGDVDEDGVAVDLWDVDDETQGTRIVESREKNEDCTVNIHQTRVTVSAWDDAVRSVVQDARKWVEETVDRHQTSAVIEAVAASGGVIKKRQASENDDGTYDNHETVITEQSLEEGRAVLYEDDEKSVTETLHENQSAAGALAEALTAGEQTEIENSKTDGLLFNVRTKITVWKKWLSQVVEQLLTVFEQRNGVTHRCLTLAETEVYVNECSAGGGKRYEWIRSKRPDGKYDLTIREFEEQLLEGVRQTSYKTAFVHEGGETKIQTTGAAAASGVSEGVIEKVESRETEGGLFENTRVSREAQLQEERQRKVDVYPYGKRVEVVSANEAAAKTDATSVGETTVAELNEFALFDNKEVCWDVAGFADVEQREVTTIEGPVTRKVTEKANVTAKLAEQDTQTPGTVKVRESKQNGRDASRPWDTVETEETAEKWSVTDVVPSADGNYRVTRYANYTEAEERALVDALDGANVNTWRPHGMNRFRLYDGVVTTKEYDEDYKNKFRFEDEDLVEYTQPMRREINGALYMVEYKLTYNLVLDWGVSSGLTSYSGAKWGSWFRHLGGDWYYYKKVTKIEVSETAYTPSSGWVEV